MYIIPALVSSQVTIADSLAALIKSEPDDTNKIKHLLQLGWELKFTNIDSSISLANRALNLSMTLESSGQKNDEDHTSKKFRAKSYANIGIFYYLKGEFDLSLEAHFNALEIQKSYSNKLGMQSSYNNIGLVFWKQGNYSKALEYYGDALKLNVELGNQSQVFLNLNNIGLIYFDQKDYHQALAYHNLAYNLSTRYGDPFAASSALNNMGNNYFALNKFKLARAYYQKALKLNIETSNVGESANNFVNIGACYEHEGRYEDALIYYKDALGQYTELGDQYGIASNLLNIGSVYLKKKDYKSAEAPLKQSAVICMQIGALERYKEVNYYLSTLYSETNRYQLAFEHYRTYSETKDSLFNDEKSKEIGRIEMGHEFERKERDKVESLRIAKIKKERRDMLQYSGISIILVFTAILIVFLGFKKVGLKTAEAVTFLSFLFLFEFLLMLLDPTIDAISGGEPAVKLMVNAALAIAIFPLNALLEKALKKRLVR